MEMAAAADDDTTTAEEIFARWWLFNAAVSNVELAHLSNATPQWRRAAKRAILEQAAAAAAAAVRHRPAAEGRRLLLLPSMVRCIIMDQNSSSSRIILRNNKGGDAVKTSPGAHEQQQQATAAAAAAAAARCDTFCAAWFPPDGIQEQRISLLKSSSSSKNKNAAQQEEEDEMILLAQSCYHHNNNNDSQTTSAAFAPSGGQTYEGSDDDKEEVRSRSSRKQQQRRRQRSKSPTASLGRMKQQRAAAEHRISTCDEWRGYQSPMDVLQHFGYAASFVDDVLSSAKRGDAIGVSSIESQQSPVKDGTLIKKTTTPYPTFAVRGAVVARPESYCYCVESKSDAERLRVVLRSSHAAANNNNNNNNATATTTTTTTDGTTDEYGDIRVQEYKQSLLRKERRRRELQRDVLPRILTLRSSGAAAPLGSSISSNNNNTPNDNNNRGGGMRGERRCVQFLNAAGSHAVCMLTPPFACGPLPEPVTVICVGIATEDGCFLSGLHHRFELGHLYPNDEVAEATELSPVCISTECCGGGADDGGGASLDDDDAGSSCVDRKYSEDDDDDDDSSCDCSDDEEASSAHKKCACIFNGVGEKLSALDEEKPRRIYRGRLGPGAWHCYVAVFDGDKSLIRIDGVSEPMRSDLPESSSCSPDGRQAAAVPAAAMLDGLTIGSDHCFGMSLCCGNGSGGEGEGAIAELAVFQGRLDVTDLQVLEQQLMARHAIPAPSFTEVVQADVVATSSADAAASLLLWRENDWARQAHALFFLPDLEFSRSRHDNTAAAHPPQVPLRFLSRHRSVAWKQSNPVTGEPIHIKRIGCKPGASSSDL